MKVPRNLACDFLPALGRRVRVLAILAWGAVAAVSGGAAWGQLPPDFLQTYHRGQQVQAIADTTLYFRDLAHSTIHAGAVVEVVSYQPQGDRLYVLGKDVNGQPIALSASARFFTRAKDSATLPSLPVVAAEPAPVPPPPAPSAPATTSIPAVDLPTPVASPSVASTGSNTEVKPDAKRELTADDPIVAALAARASRSFAFVEGQSGRGSAFVCHYQGKRMLLTNQHVVRENPELKFTQLNGTRLKLGAPSAAVGHDIFGFELADEFPALDLEMDVSNEVRMGDDVLVIGNTEGAGVVKALLGKVAGIGPQLVEVTSAFLPGNSGSPIIHMKTGRVIGIATYAIVRNANSLTGEKEQSVRRFGYRVDSVQAWQPVVLADYQAESQATTKVHAFSNSLLSLLRAVRNHRTDLMDQADPRLQAAIAFLRPLTESKANHSRGDVERAMKNFVGELKNVTLQDVEALRPTLRYDFFQREIAEENQFRTELANSLTEALKGGR